MSKITLHDRYALDDAAKVRFTQDGYMVAMPRVARTGIQLYYGRELGLTDERAGKVFRVLRPESAVMAKDSLATYAHKPVTDNHPPEDVTAGNWKQYGRGQLDGDVVRDGEFIRVPMVLMDGDLVKKYKDGKAEISMGYQCEIVWQAGTDAKYGAFDATQDNIGINHCAVVDAARGGKDLRIGDGTGARVDLGVYALALEAVTAGNIVRDGMPGDNATHLADANGTKAYAIMADGKVFLESLRAAKTNAVVKNDGDALAALDNLLRRAEGTTTPAVKDGTTNEVTMSKVVIVDGISVNVADEQSAQIIQRALDAAKSSVTDATKRATDAETKLADAAKASAEATAKNTTELAAKDAEIVTLKKTVEDAKLTPAKLDALVKDRAEIAGKARTILGDKLVVDGKDVSEIMRQVVDAKLGDKAKGWSEDQIKISFDTMTADVKPSALPGQSSAQQMQHAFAGGGGHVTDSENLLNARDKRTSEAWRNKPAA